MVLNENNNGGNANENAMVLRNNNDILAALGMTGTEEGDFATDGGMDMLVGFHDNIVQAVGIINVPYWRIAIHVTVMNCDRPDLVGDEDAALEYIKSDDVAGRLYFGLQLMCPSVYNDLMRYTNNAIANAERHNTDIDGNACLLLGAVAKFTNDGGFYQSRFATMHMSPMHFIYQVAKTIMRNGRHPTLTGARAVLRMDGTVTGPITPLMYIGNPTMSLDIADIANGGGDENEDGGDENPAEAA